MCHKKNARRILPNIFPISHNMLFPFHRKRPVWPWVIAGVLGLCIGAAGYIYYFFIAQGHWISLVSNPAFEKRIVTPILSSGGKETASLVPLLPYLLGVESPRTILVLFANNTELRPGGGFLGVYAVVRVDRGHASILAVDGTEVLDLQTPSTWQPVPPAPLKQYLGVDRWYFRDSNWSPDFPTSVQDALNLYTGEQGPYAADIDMVMTITPTILAKLLERIGPVTVDGVTFTADTAVEKLEYEVEYGFSKRGDSFIDRKQIIDGLVSQVLHKVTRDAVFHSGTYLTLATDLFFQKQIVAYAADPAAQAVFHKAGWSGEVSTTTGDYLGWVDANLAALKTDHAMTRHLSYTVQNRADGRYDGTASMTYTHAGTFDWRTSRYLTYTRVYVPQGTVLLAVNGMTRSKKPLTLLDVTEGEELGKHWIGVYFSVEPGEQKTLSFQYLLPSNIENDIRSRAYTLVVQKQIGTDAYGLTLGLDFGTTIIGARPAEAKERWGDGRYDLQTDLGVDKNFRVNF